MALSSADLPSPPPPDSWPGAHGRRSVAPEVPSWPGQKTGPAGASWPGATQPTRHRPPTLTAGRRPGGVALIMLPALVGLVLMALIGIWAWLDGERRAVQAVLVLVIALGALVMLGMVALRQRTRR
ncbi:hypothetical protein [Austwickia sp. TVS 96-490-7B]|uniref:hypothetical protein n=1 Tax=Austwickia sp. TVS 96-490-7B TaxID=2830843 RepID=UPI001C5977DD|nr:hypothetical protein [Austwickia sp. TVS 96-490-7B]